MPRGQVRSNDIRCPECSVNRMCQNGFANGRQAYRCGDFGCCYIFNSMRSKSRPGPLLDDGIKGVQVGADAVAGCWWWHKCNRKRRRREASRHCG